MVNTLTFFQRRPTVENSNALSVHKGSISCGSPTCLPPEFIHRQAHASPVSIRSVLKMGALAALAAPALVTAKPINERGQPAGGPCALGDGTPACESVTISNPADGCSVSVKFQPDPFSQSFTFSASNITFGARHAQRLALDAQPHSGFGPAVWSGADSASNPTTFTTDPQAETQSLTVTCPPVVTLTVNNQDSACQTVTAVANGQTQSFSGAEGTFLGPPGSTLALGAGQQPQFWDRGGASPGIVDNLSGGTYAYVLTSEPQQSIGVVCETAFISVRSSCPWVNETVFLTDTSSGRFFGKANNRFGAGFTTFVGDTVHCSMPWGGVPSLWCGGGDGCVNTPTADFTVIRNDVWSVQC